jgi:hypothetical protein
MRISWMFKMAKNSRICGQVLINLFATRRYHEGTADCTATFAHCWQFQSLKL